MKRFVSILAVLALVLSLSPAVFAEDSYIPAPYDPNEIHVLDTYLAPGEKGYVFGTDDLGRDVAQFIAVGSKL